MMTAIILAGGLGTRLREVIGDLPKPMAPIGNRPFLEYLLDYWIAQGVNRFILSIGYRGEIIVSHFGSMYRSVKLEYAVESVPLGTGGGLLNAMKLLSTRRPFLLLNGDTFFEIPLNKLMEFHAARRSDWTFAAFRTNLSERYLRLNIDLDGRILASRLVPPSKKFLANGGVYLISPDIIDGYNLPQFNKLSLEDVVIPNALKEGGRFYGLEFTGRFIDIGIPDDYRRAGNFFN